MGSMRRVWQGEIGVGGKHRGSHEGQHSRRRRRRTAAKARESERQGGSVRKMVEGATVPCDDRERLEGDEVTR